MNPKLILLISVDCLRADLLEKKGRDNRYPKIEELAEEGVSYNNCFTHYPATGGMVPGLFYSRYPWESGPQNQWLQEEPSLQSKLKEFGFECASIHTNPFLTRFYNWEKGFDYFFDDIDFQPNENSLLSKLGSKLWRAKRWIRYKGTSASTSEINEVAKNWVEKNKDRKMFLHLHYMDLHEPYFPQKNSYNQITSEKLSLKEKVKSLFLQRELIRNKMGIQGLDERDREFIFNLYRACLRDVDREISSFLEFLRREELLDNTLVVLTSDHGQGFGEHGFFGHMELYDEVLNIPLIFWSKDKRIKLNHKPTNQCRLVDVAPTILDILDNPVPSSFNGKSLAENKSNRKVLASFMGKGLNKEVKKNWCLRLPSHKLILTFNKNMELERREFYDLESDPREEINKPNNPVRESIEEELIKTAKRIEEKTRIKRLVNQLGFDESKKI